MTASLSAETAQISQLCGGDAESIAFYNGEAREMGVASRCLHNLINVGRLRIQWSAYLSLWTNCYSYATILAPAVITAPMYFRGEIEFGVISQVCPMRCCNLTMSTACPLLLNRYTLLCSSEDDLVLHMTTAF